MRGKWRYDPVVVVITVLSLFLAGRVLAAGIQDSESALHGGDAATYHVVDIYNFKGFRVIQFNLPVLSHYSYMLISGNQALVVDPGRDVSVYMDTAGKEGVKIMGVFLTHSHADFVAGHTQLARAVGCPVFTHASGGAEYAFRPLKEGSTIEVGEALIRFVETPGHTPDGLCAYVFGTANREVPEVIFTGDTLFVGSIGRPDLMEGTVSAASLASMSYDSWTQKLSRAGDSAVILPAHGAGSLCGAHLSDRPSSTIGEEKVSNPYLRHQKSRSEFIAAVLEGLPEAPRYFKHNAAMNRKGPEVVDFDAPLPAEISPARNLADPGKFYVVDLRDPEKYAAGHIPNSVNIGVRGRLETWVGTMVPWGEDLVLCGDRAELKEAVYRLHRVGYKARLTRMESWVKAGLPLNRNELVTPAQLYALMQKGEAPVIVDVRLPSEWMGVRIGTVVNLPLNHLAELSSKLDPVQPVVTVCNSAYRSSMAVGILERKGFTRASGLAGGSEAWIAAGLPVYGWEGGTAAASITASVPRREIRLPERISPADLGRLMMDLPGTFELVDIRPEAQFADYSLPGSTNVDIAAVMSDPAFLAGPGPLIIVDRDGSLAMAVAGILSQKTQRSIRALHGGLEAYWEEMELKSAVREVHIPRKDGSSRGPERAPAMPHAPRMTTPPPIPDTGTPPAQPPRPPRSKSAGC